MINKIISFILLLVFTNYSNNVDSQTVSISNPEFRNFYGIAWRGSPHENLQYARQMGYQYVYYQVGMEKDTLSNGLFFYVETPEYYVYQRELDLSKKITDSQINFFEQYCSLKNSNKIFPYNLATGWLWTTKPNIITVLLDFQQQKVISWAIDSILHFIAKIEKTNPKFHFGGFGWDEPRIEGDFWDTLPGKRIISGSLKLWNNFDSGFTKPGIIHNFSTYTDGHAAFYKQLFYFTKKYYPNLKSFSEPFSIYEGWILPIKNRKDANLITPDILSQEGPGTEFIDNLNIINSGLILKENLYCTTPNIFGEEPNRVIAAKAAINGSWFGWFGRFGGSGDMPDFKSIKEVPARLKLIRVLANWENLNLTPLNQRKWDGKTYKSLTAEANSDLIQTIQPYTGKLFFVFLTNNGVITVPKGKKIKYIYSTDNLFIESQDFTDKFIIRNNTIKPLTNDVLNSGFIVLFD